MRPNQSLPVAIVDCTIEYNASYCFNRLTSHFMIPFTYHYVPGMGIGSLLPQRDQKQASAYIVLGSTSNVEDRLDWQVELASFLEGKLKENIPVLGICFTHQLMGDKFGLTIDKVDGEIYLEGTCDIEFLNPGFGFNKGDRLKLLKSHGYEIKHLNEDFIHLAQSNECQFEVVGHRKYPLLCVQGHPEGSDFFIKDLDVKIEKDEAERAQNDGLFLIEKFLKFAKIIS